MHTTHTFSGGRLQRLAYALLIYTDGHAATALRAEVRHGEHGPELGDAHTITDDLRSRLSALLSPRRLQILPPNVLAVNPTAVAWYVPAAPRRMLFSPQQDPATARLSGRVFPQPPLLLVARRRQLCVYALAQDARPTADARVYRAPFWNTFDIDALCTGGVALPATVDPETTEAWERVLFESNFTHRSGAVPRWTTQFTHTELWEAAAQRGTFDPAWLVPTTLTVADAVERA